MTLQVVKSAVKVGQALLQHLGVPRVAGGFELLQDTQPRQRQTFDLAAKPGLLGSKFRARTLRFCQSVGLLSLDRLTLPSTCHCRIIREVWTISLAIHARNQYEC